MIFITQDELSFNGSFNKVIELQLSLFSIS